MKSVCLLGATGSIGDSTLDVIARHPTRYRVHSLSGYRQLDKLLDLCVRFRPACVAVPESAALNFAQRLKQAQLPTEVLAGEAGLVQLGQDPASDILVAGIVGAAGLLPTLAAAKAGKRILLANKEALVMAGELFMQTVKTHHAELLPIDSEHNAIFQCLPNQASQVSLSDFGVEKLLLTASGGPFRGKSLAQLHEVTPAQAVAHPNWSMGQKISVDSATLMNKGLELIEACWLFDVTPAQIEVVIHPQSIIHSLVRYRDGSVLAQMGQPDMRTPIAHALAWPERIAAGVEPLDLLTLGSLDFYPPDEAAFPCLNLARQAFTQGGTAPALLNAANEVAVSAFLQRRIRFTQIAELLDQVMQLIAPKPANQLELLLSEDQRARHLTTQLIQNLS